MYLQLCLAQPSALLLSHFCSFCRKRFLVATQSRWGNHSWDLGLGARAQIHTHNDNTHTHTHDHVHIHSHTSKRENAGHNNWDTKLKGQHLPHKLASLALALDPSLCQCNTEKERPAPRCAGLSAKSSGFNSFLMSLWNALWRQSNKGRALFRDS